MIYIGIDPGKRGGFAYIDDDGNAKAYSWDETLFVDMIHHIRHESDHAVIACLEKVNALPGQGVTSMFNFGTNYGFIQGVLASFHIPFQLIPPKKWKKEYSLSSDKEQSIKTAIRLFPDVNLFRNSRCIKQDDGMSEALLIAEYAKRLYKKGGNT